MNAAELLRTVVADGIDLRLSPPGDLKVSGPSEAIKRYSPALRGAKAEIVSLLRQERDGAFDERAAIVEHDGGLSRPQAEALAALHAMPVPDGVTAEAVGIVIDAAALFLDARNRTGARRAPHHWPKGA